MTAFDGDVTEVLKLALEQHEDVRATLRVVYGCTLFSSATRSAALGEVSEILVERTVRGQRCRGGNKGFDLVAEDNQKIEVKSRLISRYKDGVKFDFGPNVVKHANRVCCVAWDDKDGVPGIQAANSLRVNQLPPYRGLSPYSSRIDLKWLRSRGADDAHH